MIHQLMRMPYYLLVAVLLLDAASAQLDPATGHISPPSGVPDFNPAVWNQAYKLTLKKVQGQSVKELLQALRYPRTLLMNVPLPDDCHRDGFDTTAAAGVALGTCFSRSTSAKALDFWIKLPGLALVKANCYCYALGFFRGGYCYPGMQNGGIVNYQQKMTCKSLNQAVIGDGGEPVTRQQALSGQPSSGHYIALMARPESCIRGHCYVADFHAMRKDSSGTWSWKHPAMPATDRDMFGNQVRDPEAASLSGTYQVCGYFRVDPSKMSQADAGSDKEQGPLPIEGMLSHYRALPGVQVDITPLPYNAQTDTAVSNMVGQQALQEDMAWERTRGSEQYKTWRLHEKQALELLPRGIVSEMDGAERGSRKASSHNQQGRRLLIPGSLQG